MAIRVWKEVPTDGDFWLATNWVGDVAPIAGDVCIIDNGEQNIDTGLTSDTAVLLDVYVGPNYSGKIGSNTQALILSMTGKFTIAGGGSEVWIGPGATNIGAVVIDNPISGARTWIADGGANTIGTILGFRGILTIQDTGTITDVFSSPDADANTVFTLSTENAMTITNLYAKAGTLTIDESTITNLYLDGGNLSAEDSCTLTNVWIRGGTLTYKTTNNITVLHVIKGGFDASQSVLDFTITNAYLHEGGSIWIDGGAQVTLTNGITMRGNGVVRWPPNSAPS